MKLYSLITSVLFLILVASTATAQESNLKTEKQSLPENDMTLRNMQDTKKNADEVYERAKETYAFTKEILEKRKSIDDVGLWWLGLFITILFLAAGVSQYHNILTNNKLVKDQKDAHDRLEKDQKDAHDKIIKDAKEKLEDIEKEQLVKQSLQIQKIIEANEKTIIEMVASKERDYYLRKNAEIIVINHKDTGVSIGFEKVLSLFEKFDLKRNMKIFSKLSDSLASNNISEFRNADLVIIENQAIKGQWKIGNVVPSKELLTSIMLAGDTTQEDEKNEYQNQAIMINLANKICDKTALVYYGSTSSGQFQSNHVEEDKQHLIAFANSPSTLYSNIMNLLKFKDILEREK